MTLKELLKTTPKYMAILQKNGITTIKDFFNYFPRTHEERGKAKNLQELALYPTTDTVITKGQIIKKNIFRRGPRTITEFTFQDNEGSKGHITFFNKSYLTATIQEGNRYTIIGKMQIKLGKISFLYPELHLSQDDKHLPQINRIYPIYPELNGISPERFAQKIRAHIDNIDTIFEEYLPQEFIQKFDLLNTPTTIKNIHYPDSRELNKKAKTRVFFDRLLRIQLHSLLQKQIYQSNNRKDNSWIISSIDRDIIKSIIETIPFQLTNAQKKSLKIIIENLHESNPMMRLLQGDVGSGKTIVAAIAAYYTHKKFQAQSAFLAPLEVLAHQHHKTLSKLLLPLGLRTELLIGATSKSEKDRIKQDLKAGKIHVITGTHAILQEDNEFANLGLAVIDEQHKFGVRQRAFLKSKGSPHLLQMSATPIPRSMALAYFGEFEVSIIDELPIGRKPIITKIVSEAEYHKIKPRILEKISQGQKVFIITPLIDESEKMEDLKAATQEFEDTKILFPEIREKIAVLHGKLSSKDKEKIMQEFKSGKYCLLVSTTVIEVGIDIPEATIMIIKNAERFGLSQLHQLRGRIGRSDIQSYCFLETKKKSGDSYQRLRAMEETNDGFKLAEIDLQNRGSGEFLGTMQSGESDIPGEILTDLAFIEKAQEGAKRLLQHYPGLEWLPALKTYIDQKIGTILA